MKILTSYRNLQKNRFTK